METDFPKGTGGFMNPEKVLGQLGIKREMKIADFGCGHGYFAVPLARMVGPTGKVFAVDVLAEALEAVRSRAQMENVSNLEIIRGNLEVSGDSKIRDGEADVVLLHNVLFQTDKKAEVLKEAKRVLKPGGALELIDWRPSQGSGTIGPQGGHRISEEEAKKMGESEGFVFKNTFDAGQFHYGLAFLKA